MVDVERKAALRAQIAELTDENRRLRDVLFAARCCTGATVWGSDKNTLRHAIDKFDAAEQRQSPAKGEP